MNKILEDIFQTKEFKNSLGEVIKVHSETNRAQCEYLQQIISKNGFRRSIEIGFAFGTSTLAIVEEIDRNGGEHVVIDKFQISGWGGNGLELITTAGYNTKIEFYEEFCYEVLPKLLENKRKFDFAYIDSTKQFDWILVNFFYLDKLLETGGIIVFDDVSYPGIRKVLRFIAQFPNYQVHSQHPRNYSHSIGKRLVTLLKFLPYSKRFLKEEVMLTDHNLKINSSCVAIQKISEDNRQWDWHRAF